MIFANEDATLYICGYLPPGDIVSLAGASRDVRAMLVPHMLYSVKATTIAAFNYTILRTDITLKRFARTDTIYAILSNDDIVSPNPIPHYYTGRISIRKNITRLDRIAHEFLWVVDGYIHRRISWRNKVNNLFVMNVEPLRVIDYLCGAPHFIKYRDTPNRYTIMKLIYDAFSRAGGNINFVDGEAFETLMREIDLL